MRLKKGILKATAAALAMLMAVSAGACSPSAGNQVQGAAAAGKTPKAIERLTLVSSYEYKHDKNLKPAVKNVEIAEDFSNVADAMETLKFWAEYCPEYLDKLRENGFLVVKGGGDEFYPVYETNRYDLVPNFITTDSMLHTYHLYFAYLLKNTEKTGLYDKLLQVSKNMQTASISQLEAVKGTEWENAAIRNAAFFSVAVKLLDPAADMSNADEKIKELTESEIALIMTDSPSILESPLMCLEGDSSQEDYTQYIPRGYYTESEQLTRYFRTMMWYGRMTFLAASESQTKSAALMSIALNKEENQQLWKEIYAVTSFFAGESDDPTFYEYVSALMEAYGDVPDEAVLMAESEKWGKFESLLEDIEAPTINSIPIYENDDKKEKTVGFRFMGQRFSLDASIFQNLIFRNVGENAAGERRMLPDVLDIPAAFGSEKALELLETQGDTEYKDYSGNMEKMQNAMEKLSENTWSANLYNGWLNTLVPLTEKAGEGWPKFMQNDAWETKKLNTFAASFAELKHDTVLYSKQVYAEMGGGEEIPDRDDRGYVEPEPVVFDRMAALCKATAIGLSEFGIISDSDKENLSRLAELSSQLMVIAEKELKDEARTEEEYELIRSFGGQLEHFWIEAMEDEAEAKGVYLSPSELPAAIVTDVATDPNGEVLEIATGTVDRIYVIVEIDGELRLANGPVYSFYQFQVPTDQRLTDGKWHQMIGLSPTIDPATGNMSWSEPGKVMASPWWTEAFRADYL